MEVADFVIDEKQQLHKARIGGKEIVGGVQNLDE